MRSLILIAGAALALAACHDDNMQSNGSGVSQNEPDTRVCRDADGHTIECPDL